MSELDVVSAQRAILDSAPRLIGTARANLNEAQVFARLASEGVDSISVPRRNPPGDPIKVPTRGAVVAHLRETRKLIDLVIEGMEATDV